jgi:hypothetical protein
MMDLAAISALRNSRAGGAIRALSSLALALTLILPSPARAADPLLTVLKHTLLGAATGLVLGATITLVADEESRPEVVRWATVIGTFGGFGLGVALALQGEEDLFAGPGGKTDAFLLAGRGSARGAFPAMPGAADRLWGWGAGEEHDPPSGGRLRLVLLRLAAP